jgi:hypothetical protein
MRRRLIDPPVGPFSPLAELEAWLAELERDRAAAAPDDREDFDLAIDRAQQWISLQRSHDNLE